jgi:predicted GTPase
LFFDENTLCHGVDVCRGRVNYLLNMTREEVIILMGGRSSTHTQSVQTVYVANPETTKKLEVAQQQLATFEQQARAQGNPQLYTANATKLLDNFIEHLRELNLTEAIQKAPNERHVGVIGDISCGKSTFLNNMFGLSLPVALGHCTTKCEPVHRLRRAGGDIVYWDVPGKNDDFRFYQVENLSFVKSLDVCIILYDNDIAMVRDVVRVVNGVCPGKVIAVRTKLDQYVAGNARTPSQEKQRDLQEITQLGKALPLYFVSAHNIQFGRGERYEWDALRAEITA